MPKSRIMAKSQLIPWVNSNSPNTFHKLSLCLKRVSSDWRHLLTQADCRSELAGSGPLKLLWWSSIWSWCLHFHLPIIQLLRTGQNALSQSEEHIKMHPVL